MRQHRRNLGPVELALYLDRLSPSNPYADRVFIGTVGPVQGSAATAELHPIRLFGRTWWRYLLPANGVAVNVGRRYVAVSVYRRRSHRHLTPTTRRSTP